MITEHNLEEITELSQHLDRLIDGEVKFDQVTRMIYSTDASIYQIEPLGVVIPRSVEDVIATIEGPARNIITAERTELNLLQHLSGIATQTAKYVSEISGTNSKLIDTRKTTPGLRILEKHAVICGGGRNHRLGLDNGVLIKDNHIAVCGGLKEAIKKAKKTYLF